MFPIAASTMKGKRNFLVFDRLLGAHSIYLIGSYTSLGSTYNTFKNPALKRPKRSTCSSDSGSSTPGDSNGLSTPQLIVQEQSTDLEWLPAYELADGDLERAGRGNSGYSGAVTPL